MPKNAPEVGVSVRLRGWKIGLNKVALTKTFRDGGADLKTASSLTKEVLSGREVRVRLAQFETGEEARTALGAVGVVHVRPD